MGGTPSSRSMLLTRLGWLAVATSPGPMCLPVLLTMATQGMSLACAENTACYHFRRRRKNGELRMRGNYSQDNDSCNSSTQDLITVVPKLFHIYRPAGIVSCDQGWYCTSGLAGAVAMVRRLLFHGKLQRPIG